MIAVIAVVVIAVVIIALIFTGIIPLLHSSSSSGGGGGGGGSSSGEPDSEASPQAAAAASSYASGPWATIIAAGLVSPTQVTANTTNITGSTQLYRIRGSLGEPDPSCNHQFRDLRKRGGLGVHLL